MDFIKQYIVQSISAASNNLRLSTQKIEVVAMLRETIISSDNVEADIRQMKKITELSTLAIRLNEIYNYLSSNQLDLFKLSEKFKEHSQYLIKDLSSMLDVVTPAVYKKALDKLRENSFSFPGRISIGSANEINIDLTKQKQETQGVEKSEADILKEKFILEDEKEEDSDLFFQNYETEILKPIKSIDTMLKKLSDNISDPEQINKYAKIMKNNGELSTKIGFDIIANMHSVVAKALLLIKTRELMPGKDVIESVRACLIVIVAVVKDKEVDITNYLNRAEEFGRQIQSIKVKG